jgi:hypothetical protein
VIALDGRYSRALPPELNAGRRGIQTVWPCWDSEAGSVAAGVLLGLLLIAYLADWPPGTRQVIGWGR